LPNTYINNKTKNYSKNRQLTLSAIAYMHFKIIIIVGYLIWVHVPKFHGEKPFFKIFIKIIVQKKNPEYIWVIMLNIFKGYCTKQIYTFKLINPFVGGYS